MFTILNRIRGKYSIFAKVNAIVLGLLFYLVSSDYIISSFIAIGYLIGESFGWGLWVGTLTTQRENSYYLRDDNEGTNNGIKWLATKIVTIELNSWLNYNRVALTIRGFYWWGLTLLPLIFIMNNLIVFLSIILLSVGFTISSELGYLYSKHKNNKNGWVYQEYIYGFMQDLVILCLIWILLV